MAAADPYTGAKDALTALGDEWVPLAALLHDTNPLPVQYRYILNVALTAGVVRCRSRTGVVMDVPVASGAILNCRPTGISSTGTSGVTLFGIT